MATQEKQKNLDVQKTNKQQPTGSNQIQTPQTGMTRRGQFAAASASPFAFMRRFSEEMDRLFDDFGFGGQSRFSRDFLPSTFNQFRESLWSPQSGIIEGIGKEATFSLRENRQTIEQEEIAASNYSEATRHVLKWLDKSHWRDESTAQRLDAVGHRIVHGGETFTEPIVIDGDVIAGIENLEDLAPLHNIPALECIRTARDVLRNEMPMIAVFDTVFHRTIPSRAAI